MSLIRLAVVASVLCCLTACGQNDSPPSAPSQADSQTQTQTQTPTPERAIVRGSGNVVTETREVSGFDRVSLHVTGKLFVIQDGSESLKIRADDNFMPWIQTRVSEGLLDISQPNPQDLSLLRPSQPILYELHVKDLSELRLSGFSEAEIAQLTSDRLTLGLRGTTELYIQRLDANAVTLELQGTTEARLDNVTTEELTATAGGIAEMSVAGKSDRQQVTLRGTAEYDGSALASQAATVEVRGSSVALLRVAEQLDATATGSAAIEYYGNPNVTQDIGGRASIVRLER